MMEQSLPSFMKLVNFAFKSVKENVEKRANKYLKENVLDVEGMADELSVMAYNNYPNEWQRKDSKGIIQRLKSDIQKMIQIELRDELDDVLKNVQKDIERYWRREKL